MNSITQMCIRDRYKIEMDAQSGETLAALSIDWDQLFLGTGYEYLLY